MVYCVVDNTTKYITKIAADLPMNRSLEQSAQPDARYGAHLAAEGNIQAYQYGPHNRSELLNYLHLVIKLM